MSEPAWGSVRREITRLGGGADLSALGDAELLGLFADGRQPEAFAEIVRRHGPRVYGACRRGLGQAADADDAFQATFLVLARCARTVRRKASLAGWLHGVARRVVARAHRATARRPTVPLGPDEPPASARDPAAEAGQRELRGVIDEELARLPERYRTPLLLCEYGGHTYESAAKLLGWPAGTVSGRLARARVLLRDRLARRGLGPVTGALAVPVPAALQQSAVRLAGQTFDTNAALVAGVSVNAQRWSQEVLFAMTLVNVLKKSLIVAAGVVVLSVTAAVVARTGPGPGSPTNQPPAPGPIVAPPVPPAPADSDVTKLRKHLDDLLRQRVEMIRQEVDARKKEYEAGRGTLEILLGATIRLRQAELDLAPGPRERVGIHEQIVKILTELDEINTARYQAGRISITDFSQSRAALLEGQIALTRARLELLKAGAG